MQCKHMGAGRQAGRQARLAAGWAALQATLLRYSAPLAVGQRFQRSANAVRGRQQSQAAGKQARRQAHPFQVAGAPKHHWGGAAAGNFGGDVGAMLWGALLLQNLSFQLLYRWRQGRSNQLLY